MKILTTTDGSEVSWAVVPHAAAFARATGGSLTVVRVLDPLVDLGSVLDVDLSAAAARLSAEWEAALRAELARRGIEADVLVHRLERGVDVHRAIARVAEEMGAGMIAIHARGTGALRHALLGSVAMGVLGKAAVPVMVTGAHAAAPPAPGPYCIAVTTDGSPASASIMPHIARLAAEAPALRFVLMRVAEQGETTAVAALEALREELPATAHVELRAGQKTADVAARIIELAIESGADAIAMASHGHGALRHLIAGSVALEVLGRSPLPVILARSGRA